MFLLEPWDWQIRMHNNHKTLIQMLDLSSRQIEYEELIREESRQQVKPILLELEKTTKEYKELIKNKADSNAIIDKKKKIDKLQKKYNKIQKEYMERLKKILTPEQNKKFKIIRTQLFLKY